MKNFKSISEVNVGDFVFDTYNEFGKKDFEFIGGQSYNESFCLCEVVDKTHDTVCVRVNVFPLRILKKDGGGVSNPIVSNQWYKFVREHDYEIGFAFRFKKLDNE